MQDPAKEILKNDDLSLDLLCFERNILFSNTLFQRISQKTYKIILPYII